MISKEEYKFITDKISETEQASKKAGSLCADIKKTTNLISRTILGSDSEIFANTTGNQIDYFISINSSLQSVALDKYIESITEALSATYAISSDVDEVFINTWPASVSVDDLTITNFTSRPGDTLASAGTLDGDGINSILVSGISGNVIKNCSFYWAVDSCVSIINSPGAIMEYCIVAESLYDSFHPDGAYGHGITIAGPTAQSNYDPYIIRNNLFAHNREGTPNLYSSLPDPGDGLIRGQLRATYANNVSYNFGTKAVMLDGDSSILDNPIMQVDFVGNVFIQGPDTNLATVKSTIQQANAENIYQKDNIIIFSDGTFQDLIKWAEADNLPWKSEPNFYVNYEPDYKVVIEDVLDNAGSRVRDYQDDRIIIDVKRREGEIIDSQSEVERPLQTGISTSDNLTRLIIALQQHILARYDTIDDWLSEQGILVKQDFYDLSNNLGYTISNTYLE